MNRLALGSPRLGLSTKVLPQASATGNIHIGTITGKLNGVMPATTPSGWRSVQLSMPVETWSVKSPLSSCGMPQANSTMSMPRVTSPCASVNTLPCSAVIIARQRVLVLVQQLQELEHHARAADRRRVGPGREGGLRGGHGGVHFAAAGQRHLAGDRAGGGVVDGLGAGAVAAVRWPLM